MGENRVGYRDSGCADRRDRRQKSPAFAKGALSQKGRFFNARKNIIYSFIYFPLGKIEPTKMTWLPMCGFIAQLVEHRTGIRGGHGFEPR